MSWLDAMLSEALKNLPSFEDRSGGLDDIARVVAVVEKAIDENAKATAHAHRENAQRAAANPFHNFIKNPVFAPAAVEQFNANLTFPRILRSALFIAIYSHTEYLLLSWCESVSQSAPVSFRGFKREDGESTPHRYARYLRDGVGIPFGQFEAWPEWERLDAYRLARNCLAHNGGIVEDDDQRRRIGALLHVEIDDTGFQVSEPIVHLLPGGCEAALETAKAFLEKLISAAEALEQKDPGGSLPPG